MAVEQQESADRQIVSFTWDKDVVTGEVVQLRCVNPENGDVSVSGLSRNDGAGFVSYPLGYSGSSEITVSDNDGNQDVGLVTVGEQPATEPPVEGEEPPEIWKPEFPTNPIEIPDLPPSIWGGAEEPFPTPPIVIHPGDDDFWTGNLPPYAAPH